MRSRTNNARLPSNDKKRLPKDESRLRISPVGKEEATFKRSPFLLVTFSSLRGDFRFSKHYEGMSKLKSKTRMTKLKSKTRFGKAESQNPPSKTFYFNATDRVSRTPRPFQGTGEGGPAMNNPIDAANAFALTFPENSWQRAAVVLMTVEACGRKSAKRIRWLTYKLAEAGYPQIRSSDFRKKVVLPSRKPGTRCFICQCRAGFYIPLTKEDAQLMDDYCAKRIAQSTAILNALETYRALIS
jgi:hypothetical protein